MNLFEYDFLANEFLEYGVSLVCEIWVHEFW